MTLPRPAVLAALVGGACWTVEFVAITIKNGTFVLDTPIFLIGLVSLVAASVLVAIHLTGRMTGARRVAAAVGLAVVLLVGAGLVEAAVDALVKAVYSGTNKGLTGETGLLVIGLAWIAVALAGRARGQRRAAAAV